MNFYHRKANIIIGKKLMPTWKCFLAASWLLNCKTMSANPVKNRPLYKLDENHTDLNIADAIWSLYIFWYFRSPRSRPGSGLSSLWTVQMPTSIFIFILKYLIFVILKVCLKTNVYLNYYPYQTNMLSTRSNVSLVHFLVMLRVKL